MNDDRASRILKIAKQFGVTRHNMATQSGIGPSNLNKMLDGQQTITDKTLRKIADAFPSISYEWLKTGEGEMLKQFDNISNSTIPNCISNNPDYRLIPLINIDSVGGIHSANSIEVSEQFVIRQIPFTEARSGDVAIIQSGNSMYPTIPSGSVLLIREVPDWREYFGYGGIFVLWLKDGRRITKEIRRYDADPKNYVWCVSYNPDVADEELPKSMIRGVWKVVKYLADFGW